MSSSTPNLKFLLDENVRGELFQFLKEKGVDVKVVPKSATDARVASLSKTENRILVTNDKDFAEYTNDQVFSVVLLQIPQNQPKALVTSFKQLIKEVKNFKGKLLVLKKEKWEEFPSPKIETS